MPVYKVIDVIAFDKELGKLGFDFDKGKSFFQYNPEFLDSGKYSKLFPFIFRPIKSVQIFKEYQGDTFQGLPPMIADSLPDTFGNLIFQEWLNARGIRAKELSMTLLNCKNKCVFSIKKWKILLS